MLLAHPLSGSVLGTSARSANRLFPIADTYQLGAPTAGRQPFCASKPRSGATLDGVLTEAMEFCLALGLRNAARAL